MNALKLLSRSEMRNIMAGGDETIGCPDDFSSCVCAGSNDEVVGNVCCSEDIDATVCCQLQYPTTSYGKCAGN